MEGNFKSFYGLYNMEGMWKIQVTLNNQVKYWHAELVVPAGHHTKVLGKRLNNQLSYKLNL